MGEPPAAGMEATTSGDGMEATTRGASTGRGQLRPAGAEGEVRAAPNKGSTSNQGSASNKSSANDSSNIHQRCEDQEGDGRIRSPASSRTVATSPASIDKARRLPRRRIRDSRESSFGCDFGEQLRD